MLSPRRKTDGALLRDQANPLVSFFLEATYTLPLYLYIEGVGKWLPHKSNLKNKETAYHETSVSSGGRQRPDSRRADPARHYRRGHPPPIEPPGLPAEQGSERTVLRRRRVGLRQGRSEER